MKKEVVMLNGTSVLVDTSKMENIPADIADVINRHFWELIDSSPSGGEAQASETSEAGQPLLADAPSDVLKSCPFCGGEGTLARGEDVNDVDYYYIRCVCCSADGGYAATISGSRGKWNNRV